MGKQHEVVLIRRPVACSKVNIINSLELARRAFLLTVLIVLLSMKGFGQLTADFFASSTTICSGSAVTFTNNSTGASDTAIYYWDFGAGATPAFATGKGPYEVRYTGSGPISVSLTITDTISSTKTKADYITVFSIPAAPAVSVTDNCDTTSTLSTAAAGTLLWSTLEMSSSIIVKTPGVYTVTTTVNGCTSLSGSGTATPKISPAVPVESVDCSLGTTKAVINILSPVGAEFEYKLDGGIFQSRPSFTKVANGSHKITVRNNSGCITAGDFFDVSCGCTDPATVTLSSNSGSTCGLTPVTVSGNIFGGLADNVTISENGNGSVSPASAFTSPFSFTYTPKAGDLGKTVIITVTTNNPPGTACVAAKDTYTLTVEANPATPLVSKINQPTCSEPTGSIILSGLPVTGTWTLTRSPDGIITTGNGISITILNIPEGTYTYTVTSENGCLSQSSDSIVIKAQPITPSPPEIGTITHPTCSVSTGSVVLNGLPAIGVWTLTRNPGGVTTTGSGTDKTISDLPAGSYTFTVINSDGCTSVASAALIINPQPPDPDIPIVGTITSPTCTLSTGSVDLNGLPVSGTWILTRYPGTIKLSGTGTSATISGLPSGMYNFTLTSETGCISATSANVIIPDQPVTPLPPLSGAITLPTCTLPTASVVLNGLPSPGTWNLIRYPGGTITSGTGTTITISGLSVGKYTFTVTNAAGCISILSSEISIPLQPGIPSVSVTDPPVICSSDKADLTSASITAGSTPGLTFTYWTDPDTTIPYLTPAAAGEGTYYIKGISVSGCFDIKPVTVTVNPLPIANAGPDQVLEYLSETTLNAIAPDESETGIWSVISGTARFTDSTYAKTMVSGLSPGRNELLWKIISGVCPPSFDTVMITVHEIKIQSLITPNMDGRNDYFIIHGLNTMGKTELVIFDRRGAQVYKNADYDNLWNGVDYNDKPLPDDTYFFVINPEHGRSVSGFIVIRR